jgi:hypothetical protein
MIWCNVGSDVDNGIWAMMGARQGCYMTNLTDWDYRNVRDFDYLTDMWHTQVKEVNVNERLDFYAKELVNNLDLNVATLDSVPSKFFKMVYQPHNRVDLIERD